MDHRVVNIRILIVIFFIVSTFLMFPSLREFASNVLSNFEAIMLN